MKKLYPLLSVLFLIYWGCEEEQPEEVDTTPPTVSIQSPITNQSINEIVTIVVESNDNEGINRVEFYIDDSLVLTDTELPYEYEWNTTQYENNSEHIVKVISYDNSDNSTTSQPIMLTVDNSTSTPNGGNITSVTYTLTEMTVEWEESTDGDFRDYKVLHSDTESGDRDILETYTDKSTTSYTITEFDPLIENWFWVQVTDTLGLSSIGTGMTNSIDNVPNPVNVTSVIYDLEEMTITWEEYVPNTGRIQRMNQNTRSTVTNDFVSYELLQSDTEDGTYTSVTVITDQSTTSHSLTEYDPTHENWFKVKVTDYWGLNSTGTGMTNEIEESIPPTPSVLYPITYNDGFQISWSQNNDDDFQSYKLYESLSQDMSNQTLVYETTERENTNYVVTGISENKYYQITNEDVSGLQSRSNIEFLLSQVELWGVVYSIEDTDSLNLSYNELTGSIPPEIGNLTNLTYLRLLDNQLTGVIPPEIGNLTNLTLLWLSNNEFTGEIPSEIGNLTDLTYLDLGNNELTGSIPPEIWNLTNLTYLNLNGNHLTGEIPQEIGNLTNLTLLWLSNNNLTGSIPPEIGNLTNLTELTLGNNQLSGEIPSEIGNLTNLNYLYLYDNQLSGSIPSEIGNLTNLTRLYLDNNQLTGEIPESICDLTLDTTDYHFNISNNQLCPPYPSCVEDYVGEQDTSGCD